VFQQNLYQCVFGLKIPAVPELPGVQGCLYAAGTGNKKMAYQASAKEFRRYKLKEK